MRYIGVILFLFMLVGCSEQQNLGTIRAYNGEVIREDPTDTIVMADKEYPMRGEVGDFTVFDADFIAGKAQTYTFYIWFGNKNVDKQLLHQDEIVEWNQSANEEKQNALGKQIKFTAIESETFEKQNIATGIIEPLSEEEERFPLGTTAAKVVTTMTIPSNGVWKLEGSIDGQSIGDVTVKVN